MAERIARMDEDSDSIKFIEQVYTLSKSEVVQEKDDFAKSAEWARSLSGTTSNFKRKITNELKKYNRSADGKVSSKQLDENSTASGYDAFGVVLPPYSLDALVELYTLSSPHYAAVNAKVSNIAGLGYKLVETNKTRRAIEALAGDEKRVKKARAALDAHKYDLLEQIENFNEEDTFTETLTRVWTDYEVTGNGYIEVGRRDDGTIAYVGHIPSQTIRIRKERDGYVQISAEKAQFFMNFGDTKGRNPIGDYEPNEIIHIKNYSPVSTYYGIPDIVAAQQAVAGDEFASRFNLDYFENKAVPRHVITLKGADLGSAAKQEILTFFETGLKGQNHRSLFIPLPPDDGNNKVEFKIEPVETGTQDSSFNNYKKLNRADVLMVHRVPISKVSTAEGASLAIARDADKTFKEQVCQPKQKIYENKIDRILKELTDAYRFDLEEMTLTDENTQSQIDERRIKTGTETPNEQRIKRGQPPLPGGDELLDLNAASKLKQQQINDQSERQRDADRSANQTDGVGEARNPKGDGRVQS